MAENPLQTDTGAAIIRTVAPYLTAWIVAKLAEKGINANVNDVMTQVVLVGGSIWYTIVRFLEARWPKAGYLLGVAKTPTYTKEA